MINPKINPVWVTYMNYLGGFDYFLFLGFKQFDVNISDSGTTKQNIFPQWPISWGQNADTVEKKTFTIANDEILFTSQFLTANQRDALKYIKISPVVQIVESRTDRRTIIVDTDSFKIYNEQESNFFTQFRAKYTNELQSQRL